MTTVHPPTHHNVSSSLSSRLSISICPSINLPARGRSSSRPPVVTLARTRRAATPARRRPAPEIRTKGGAYTCDQATHFSLFRERPRLRVSHTCHTSSRKAAVLCLLLCTMARAWHVQGMRVPCACHVHATCTVLSKAPARATASPPRRRRDRLRRWRCGSAHASAAAASTRAGATRAPARAAPVTV